MIQLVNFFYFVQSFGNKLKRREFVGGGRPYLRPLLGKTLFNPKKDSNIQNERIINGFANEQDITVT